jgi:hypothetical protein
MRVNRFAFLNLPILQPWEPSRRNGFAVYQTKRSNSNLTNSPKIWVHFRPLSQGREASKLENSYGDESNKDTLEQVLTLNFVHLPQHEHVSQINLKQHSIAN